MRGSLTRSRLGKRRRYLQFPSRAYQASPLITESKNRSIVGQNGYQVLMNNKTAPKTCKEALKPPSRIPSCDIAVACSSFITTFSPRGRCRNEVWSCSLGVQVDIAVVVAIGAVFSIRRRGRKSWPCNQINITSSPSSLIISALGKGFLIAQS